MDASVRLLATALQTHILPSPSHAARERQATMKSSPNSIVILQLHQELSLGPAHAIHITPHTTPDPGLHSTSNMQSRTQQPQNTSSAGQWSGNPDVGGFFKPEASTQPAGVYMQAGPASAPAPAGGRDRDAALLTGQDVGNEPDSRPLPAQAVDYRARAQPTNGGSTASKVIGSAEKTAGMLSRNEGMVERGEARKTGDQDDTSL